MTRILILGAAGMLGHKLYQTYQKRYETWGTVRTGYGHYADYGIYDKDHLIGGVDAINFDTVMQALATVQPDVVINCIGIVKQLPIAKDPIVSLTINSLFPHRLGTLCQASGTRLFHIGTDCVFNGHGHMYTEDDPSDAEDLYGRSKYLGEVALPGTMTLRTSIIGRELNSALGLVEWFLTNKGGKVRGFREAQYTGFTTQAMAQIIADLIDHHPELSGLYQVSSDVIDKYELLLLLRDAYKLDIEIEPDNTVRIDRSLDSSRFREATGFTPPSWQSMIQTMVDDPTPYDEWRQA